MFSLIIYTPISHADRIRKALADSGAGRIGTYDSCSFSARGIGRFRPLKGSSPAIGTEDKLEEVDEERIEVIVTDESTLTNVIRAVKAVHPYEEPAMHVVRVEDYRDFE